jgi:hypothetical protein
VEDPSESCGGGRSGFPVHSRRRLQSRRSLSSRTWPRIFWSGRTGPCLWRSGWRSPRLPPAC